ncbi:MAG: DMT family transporter [Thermoleophilia bacterium]
MRWKGPLLAFLAALTFSLSVPVSKALLNQVSPLLLAGLLYLGAGVGLSVYRLSLRLLSAGARDDTGSSSEADPSTAASAGTDWWWLGAATASGAVAAPLLLLWGLKETPGATASLLLSFEAVFTALWAARFFGEHVAPQVWGAAAAVTLGGIVLGLNSGGSWGLSAGALAVIVGCALWGLDNNLTRNIKRLDPSSVAQFKGLAAGLINLAAAWALAADFPPLRAVAAAMFVGALSYGGSLVLFIHALRHLGSSRTSAYFGSAPFMAAAISLVAAGQRPTLTLLLGGAFMVVGAVFMLMEQHVHEHEHDGVTHVHWHAPDAEHRHSHAASGS